MALPGESLASEHLTPFKSPLGCRRRATGEKNAGEFMTCKLFSWDVLVYVKSAHVLQIQTVLLVFPKQVRQRICFFYSIFFRVQEQQKKAEEKRDQAC